jgi:hypothetical protein
MLGGVDAVPGAAQQRSYVWFGEIAGLEDATRTATVSARIPPYVVKYVDRFKAGDRLVLVWNMIGKKEATQVLALWRYDEVKDSKGGNTGYVIPVEFVSADAQAQTVTFKVRVPESAIATLKSAKPGQTIKVTAPMDQPSQDATLTSIELAARPADTGEKG